MSILSNWFVSAETRRKKMCEDRKIAAKALKQRIREVRRFEKLWNERALTADEEQYFAISRRAICELKAYICARCQAPKRRVLKSSFFRLFDSSHHAKAV